MTSHTLNGQHPRLAVYPIQIFRVDPGQSYMLRMLSEKYFGLFTHYVRNRGTVICRSNECDTATHKLEQIWKGYACADYWDLSTKKWHPTVLEITEHLELDFRYVYSRGQVWEIFREATHKRKPSKLTGKLHETQALETLPHAFDLVPVLRALYHTTVIELDKKNPLPDRVLEAPRDGAPPQIFQEKKITPEEAEASKRRLAEEIAKMKRGSPATDNAKRVNAGRS